MGTSGTVGVGTDDIEIVLADEIRVLVIGSKLLDRQGMARMLEKQDDIDIVAVTDTGDALSRVGQLEAQVAVVLYDDGSQLDLCRRLSIRRPPVGVVVADSFRSVRDFSACREAGATGFVRTDSPGAVIEAVRAVAVGRQFRDPGIPDEPPDPYGLTEREMDVLSCLRPGCSNREIAEQLHIAEGTVKYHLCNIYEKLQVHTREEALVLALEENIVRYERPRRHT